ncbi:hypothetical protein IFM89_021323 [Coptis chinensis]|uniref:Uncharacterized protein n=1 Tax=Coptis chinensis TaxID=261450 RepID=A0A835HXJ0_9MAGN|nr:hypothetical protein IFM89_021323 [Coptis chinensis]
MQSMPGPAQVLELCAETLKGWTHLRIGADSTSAVQSFGNRDPLEHEDRWQKAMPSLNHVLFTSTWREVSSCADCMANFGVKLGLNVGMNFAG